MGAAHTAVLRIPPSPDVHYECAFACDIDEGARALYRENFGVEPAGDIYALELERVPDFDLLVAGFPCQPFSIAGKKRGFRDPTKGGLFHRLLELLDAKRPRVALLENVKNLLSINGGRTIKAIQKELEMRGYHVSMCLLNAKHFGVPQARERLFIVADRERPYVFVEPRVDSEPPTVMDIMDTDDTSAVVFSETYDAVPSSGKGMVLANLINRVTGKGGRQGQRIYRTDCAGPTITAHGGGLGGSTGLYDVGNGRVRRLNRFEALRMFGFDDTYKHASLGKRPQRLLQYLGNSICVPVLEHIIRNIDWSQANSS